MSGGQSCRQLAFACKRGSERFIGETIESVLGQDFENLELIMVNGASTDAKQAVIERHAKQDARLSVISRA
jgi:glycosyltransferase involved in cell wall biosynthesis